MDTITFNEFRLWLTGLIQGKKGALPDIDDWKEIKKQLDRVVPDKEVVITTVPTTPDVTPQPSWEWNPNTSPYYIGDNTGTFITDGWNMTTTSTGGEQLNLELGNDMDMRSLTACIKNQTITNEEIDRVLREALDTMISEYMKDGEKETD